MMGCGELLVILVIILILFGGKKLPEFAKSLGQGIREFKKACNGEEEIIEVDENSLKNQKKNKIIDSNESNTENRDLKADE